MTALCPLCIDTATDRGCSGACRRTGSRKRTAHTGGCPPRVLTAAERVAIVAAYTEDHEGLSAIALTVHTHTSVVRAALVEAGIKICKAPYARGASTAPLFTFAEHRFIDSVKNGIGIDVAAELARIPMGATKGIIARGKRFGEL